MAQQTAVGWLKDKLKETYDKEGKLPLAYTLHLVEQAKQMEKDQMKVQTSIDLLKDKAQKAWTPCHGCDDNDKNFWINGYIHGALEN